jgi:FkbM family methyltransferase
MTSPETRIIAHHIGGRGFGVAFNAPAMFKTDIVHVLYDADSESVDEMNRTPDMPQAELLGERYLLPYCLGRQNGTGKLNITANAYASSMLTPDPSFFKYYCEMQIGPAVYDVTYDDMLEIVKEVDVEVHSLDQLFAEGKLPVKAKPDFLSLDTQGLERDIIEGAQQVIREDVLGIVTEVEMVPMYEGQPLLGDILHIMNAHGFHFAGFTTLHEISQYRAPIGLRGKSFPGFGDALFLRKIDTLDSMGLSKPELFLKANKLAFISLVFGYVEHALKALEAARSLSTDIPADLLTQLKKHCYWQFLKDVEAAANTVESVYPPIFGVPQWARPIDHPGSGPTWSDAHHNDAVEQCYRAAHAMPEQHVNEGTVGGAGRLRFVDFLRYIFLIEPATSTERIRTLALTRPHKAVAKAAYYALRSMYFRLRSFGLISDRTAGKARGNTRELPPSIMDRLSINEGYSAFESVLSKHGLGWVADIVRKRRVALECFVRSLDPELRGAKGWSRLDPVKYK